jgi:hypothetical protein
MEAKKLYQAFYFVERERMENGESDLFGETAKETSEDSEDNEAADYEDETSDQKDVITAEAADSSETVEETDLYEPAETGDASEENDYTADTPSDEITAFDDEDEKEEATYVMKADQYTWLLQAGIPFCISDTKA